MNAKLAVRSIAITIMILFTLSLTLEPANGMARRRARDKNPDKITVEGTHEGPGGRIFRTRTEGERTEGGFLRQRTLTGPDGQTATGETRGWWDPETKTWRSIRSVTGPDGQVRTGTSESERLEDGSGRRITTTGAGGETVEREVRWSYDEETGTWKREVTATGADGESHTGTSEFNATTGGGSGE
ncbi:MAG: hypothetical protein Q8R92_10755 [Deltaproteobacteria bacterium]|nr:hypothetical protein [Deltaproteobacteria bacterium]